jgi:hypothetical protein
MSLVGIFGLWRAQDFGTAHLQPVPKSAAVAVKGYQDGLVIGELEQGGADLIDQHAAASAAGRIRNDNGKISHVNGYLTIY